ncbi:MAG TPA: DUF4199 domain-containing protein [Thermoanaerobaculia bacterium]|jgi:Zn-dependent protease with chaperone function
MKKVVLKYGLIAGVLLAVWTGVVFPLTHDMESDMAVGMVIGYSAMILAFVTIFLAIRADREERGGITFGRALGIGLLVALIGSAFYVAGWQFTYYNYMPDFAEKYSAVTMQKARAANKSPQELAAMQKEMDDFVREYKKPLVNIGFTFLEVLPVGVILAFVAAGILRRKPGYGTTAEAIA